MPWSVMLKKLNLNGSMKTYKTRLFNLYAEYIMWNVGLDEAQAGIKIAWKNVNKLRYADGTTLMAESKEEIRASWLKWKRRVKKLA